MISRNSLRMALDTKKKVPENNRIYAIPCVIDGKNCLIADLSANKPSPESIAKINLILKLFEAADRGQVENHSACKILLPKGINEAWEKLSSSLKSEPSLSGVMLDSGQRAKFSKLGKKMKRIRLSSLYDSDVSAEICGEGIKLFNLKGKRALEGLFKDAAAAKRALAQLKFSADEMSQLDLLGKTIETLELKSKNGRYFNLFLKEDGILFVGSALEGLSALIEKGGVNCRNSEGQTLLMRTTIFGKADAAIFLLSKGADINAKDNDGITALMQCAADKGASKRMLGMFLACPGVNVNARDKRGETALMKAAIYGNPVALKALLSDKRVDLTAKNSFGETAYDLVLRSGTKFAKFIRAEIMSRQASE